MWKKGKQYERDFGKSPNLRNAMNLTEEFHSAQKPEKPFRDYRKRRHKRLGNILKKNIVKKALKI
jgi:hypothetical protein